MGDVVGRQGQVEDLDVAPGSFSPERWTADAVCGERPEVPERERRVEAEFELRQVSAISERRLVLTAEVDECFVE